MAITYEHLSEVRPDGITDECIKATYEDGTQKFIPLDNANLDYQVYLASLEGAE